jgi:hypothetical protein
MVVPMGFQYWDYMGLKASYRELSTSTGPSDADVRLAERASKDLSEFVRQVGRTLSTNEKPDTDTLHSLLDSFLKAWKLFRDPATENLAALPYAQALLDNADPTSAAAWDAALTRIASHRGATWTEDPLTLQKALSEALQARTKGATASRKAFERLKNVATTFRARLLGVDSGEQKSPEAVFEARVRGTRRLILLELIRLKEQEIFRIALLALAGVLLAVFFSRALWNELIHPLQRLRGAMNNMAMSGSPSRVKVEGPREIKDVLGAYNRLLDTIAGETAPVATGDACSRCNRETQKGDQYCPSCGFPLPAS